MNHHLRVRILLACLAALVVCSAPRADAAILAGTEFSVDIGGSARVLNAIGTPEYDAILMDDSCDNPHLRVRANNKPAIKVSVADTTTPGVQLSSFSLAINSDPYFFGTGDVATDNFTDFIRETMYVDDGVTILGSTLSADMKLLTVNFDGMTAGKSAIFNVDLDVVDDPSMFLYPDFRVVLFGAPVSSMADPTEPGTISGVFTDGLESLTQSTDLTQQTDVPDYFNQYLRPYHVMDAVPVNPDGVEEELSDPFKINFGTLMPDEMGMILEAAKIANNGDTGTIIDVYSYMITGPDADLFKLKNTTVQPGEDLGIQLIGNSPTEMMATFDMTFMGSGDVGMYTADLILKTSAGDVTFPIMAMVEIPEPSTVLLGACGLALLAVRRRR